MYDCLLYHCTVGLERALQLARALRTQSLHLTLPSTLAAPVGGPTANERQEGRSQRLLDLSFPTWSLMDIAHDGSPLSEHDLIANDERVDGDERYCKRERRQLCSIESRTRTPASRSLMPSSLLMELERADSLLMTVLMALMR